MNRHFGSEKIAPFLLAKIIFTVFTTSSVMQDLTFYNDISI